MIGTVKFFNTAKGYGFIRPDDNSKDVFVHISTIQKSDLREVTEGDKIAFDNPPAAKVLQFPHKGLTEPVNADG